MLALCGSTRAHTVRIDPTPTPPPSVVITLTGGPNPSPAVIGNTVRARWSARVEGGPAERAECLTQNATYTWSVDSFTWTPSGGTAQDQAVDGVTLQSNNATASTSWVVDKPGTWSITVRCRISYTGSECGGAWSGEGTGSTSVSVQGFVLHPSSGDFINGTSRVLTSKKRGDSYYSINNTTRANDRAQTRDGSVAITAHLPPEGDGSTIHFRIVDPDDASPYEPDEDGNDNYSGALSAESAQATLTTINDNEVAAAEVVLTLGSRLGDNYIVEASGDPSFPPDATQRTALMVSWNRAYVELDSMYARGATVTEEEPVAAGDTTELRLDSTVQEDGTSLFTPRNGTTPGTSVVIFTCAPFTVPGSGGQSTTIAREVLAVTATTISVERIGVPIQRWSGVRLAGDASGYAAPTGLIETAYGQSTEGADGGAFIEFKRPINGSRTVPHLAAFASVDDWEDFSLAWFSNSAADPNNYDPYQPANNTFQLLTAARMADQGQFNATGLTYSHLNISTVFTRSLRQSDNAVRVRSFVFQQKLAVHELGHQFPPLDVTGENGHVDVEVNAPNILPPTHPDHDDCIMSYNFAQNTGTAKFDILCYEDLRRRTGAQ